MKLDLMRDPEFVAELGDIPDDVLLAQIESELPRYLRARLRAKAPFLAGLAVLAVIGLGRTDDSSPSAAQSSQPARLAPISPDAVPSEIAAPSGVPLSPFVAPSSSPPPLSPEPTSPTTPSSPPTTTVDPEDGASLAITASGYASTAGGTPLELEPADGGLPVQAAAGQPLRRSFVRLSGGGAVLRLALDPATSNIGAEQAAIDACPITDDAWQPKRGVPLAEGPSFDEAKCVAGIRLSDGTWTFDLTAMGDASGAAGIALVPSAAALAQTFDVVFAPQALEG